jgi:hypothetical protein
MQFQVLASWTGDCSQAGENDGGVESGRSVLVGVILVRVRKLSTREEANPRTRRRAPERVG